jgi:hypothetical protein
VVPKMLIFILEGLDQVRLESVCVSDALDAGLANTNLSRDGCAWTNGSRWLELVCVVFLITAFTIAAGIDVVRPGRGASLHDRTQDPSVARTQVCLVNMVSRNTRHRDQDEYQGSNPDDVFDSGHILNSVDGPERAKVAFLR